MIRALTQYLWPSKSTVQSVISRPSSDKDETWLRDVCDLLCAHRNMMFLRGHIEHTNATLANMRNFLLDVHNQTKSYTVNSDGSVNVRVQDGPFAMFECTIVPEQPTVHKTIQSAVFKNEYITQVVLV